MLDITINHDEYENILSVEIDGEASTMTDGIYAFIADLDADDRDYIITNHYI